MDALFGFELARAWSLTPDPLAGFALVLLAAVLAGELAARCHLPRISAYVVTGMLLGSLHQQPWLSGLLPAAQQVFQLAFALLLFELGQRVDLGWLRRNPGLLATSLAESGLSAALVFAVLLALGFATLPAAFCAALAMATGPAVVLGVCRDAGARGQLSERLMLLCALNSATSFLLLGILVGWQHSAQASPLHIVLLAPLQLVIGSAALGMLTAWAVLRLLALIRPGRFNQTLAALALVALTVAAARAFELSMLLAVLSAGMLSRSLDRKRRLQPMDFGLLGRVALIVVFLAVGARLEPGTLLTALVPALALIGARALGKFAAVSALGHAAALPPRKALLLGASLMPMSGVTLLWIEQLSQSWPELGAQVAAVVVSALLILEILAPPLLHGALHAANETGAHS